MPSAAREKTAASVARSRADALSRAKAAGATTLSDIEEGPISPVEAERHMFARTRAPVLSTTAVPVMSGLAAGAALAQQPAETAIPDKVRLFIPYKDYSRRTTSASSRCTSGCALRTSPTAWTSSACRTSARRSRDSRALEGHGQVHASHRGHRGDGALRADEPPRAADGQQDHRPLVQHDHVRSVHESAASRVDAGHRCHGRRRVAEHRIVEHPGLEEARDGGARHRRRARRHRRDHLSQGAGLVPALRARHSVPAGTSSNP